jgi:RimJ/RimL family protein N-acetyltransferase
MQRIIINFNDLTDINLTNQIIDIHPYTVTDRNGLIRQYNPNIFKYFTRNYKSCDEFIQDKLEQQKLQNQILFIVSDVLQKNVIGTFSLGSLDLRSKVAEVMSIWFGDAYVGKFYNAMTNYLILSHLFEDLNFNRVQWKTDNLNLVSQKAALSVGYTYEGTLRCHMLRESSGTNRDTMMYSIIKQEWGGVKLRLEDKIARKLQH